MTKQSRKGLLPFSSISLVKLYVRVLSVKMFVKIVDSVFVYGGECVVNVT